MCPVSDTSPSADFLGKPENTTLLKHSFEVKKLYNMSKSPYSVLFGIYIFSIYIISRSHYFVKVSSVEVTLSSFHVLEGSLRWPEPPHLSEANSRSWRVVRVPVGLPGFVLLSKRAQLFPQPHTRALPASPGKTPPPPWLLVTSHLWPVTCTQR